MKNQHIKKPSKEKSAEDKLFIKNYEERVELVKILSDRIQLEKPLYNRLTKTLKEDK